MVTYAVTKDTIAVILDGSETISPRDIIESCLIAHGLEPWPDIEAEQFSFCGQRLLIARPRPPLLSRTNGKMPRLHRTGQ